MSDATTNDQKPDVVPFVLNIDPARERITTVFPAGATIEADGSLRLKEGGRIGGVIKGNVYSDSGTLLIDQDAIVEGNVVAKGRCIIIGQVGLPNRRATIRCEAVDGLLISHIAQLHANIEHNGIMATNVSGQIQKIGEVTREQVADSSVQQSSAGWRPPGQQPRQEQVQMPHGAPPALEHNPSPIANFGNTVPLRVVLPSRPEQEHPQQQGYAQPGAYGPGIGASYGS